MTENKHIETVEILLNATEPTEEQVNATLDGIFALVQVYMVQICAGRMDDENTVSIVNSFSSMLSGIVTSCLVRNRSPEEGLAGSHFPEAVERAVEIFRSTLIADMRTTLEENGVPDPWAQSEINAKTTKEILEELNNEKSH